MSYTATAGIRSLRRVWVKPDGPLSINILDKLSSADCGVASDLRGTVKLFYKNTGVLYWTTFTKSAPECFINGKRTPSSRQTELNVRSAAEAAMFHVLLNSSLFYVVHVMHSNCRDLNPSDIGVMRYPSSLRNDRSVETLSKRLHADQQKNSRFRVRQQRQTGEVRLQSFLPALSKGIVNKIDVVIGRHLGLTSEEVDFIVNYDVKYRVGADGETDDE